MLNLNKDIFFLILEELQDDSKSLFSCLLVNRFWCETVIPILWRNPWCYKINYSKKNYLFELIVSYLSKFAKKVLKKRRIKLPSFSHQSLLFDYLSFCRSINIRTINSLISIGTRSAKSQSFLQREICISLMKKCPKLKYLDMIPIEPQIFYLPEAKLSFESLYELKCNTSVDSLHFYGLAFISQYIQRLIIVSVNNVDRENYHGIAKLIGVQKNLRYFEWINGNYAGLDPYKEILLTLEKKADTINHLIIRNVNGVFLQKVLPKFHKLKTLIINNFERFNEEQLRMCVYPDLEVFRVDYENLRSSFIIIENNGRNLKKILSGQSYHRLIDNIDKDSLILIRKIHENCPSIEHLTLAFPPSMKHFMEFEKLLEICQNLRSLILVVSVNYNEDLTHKLDHGERLLRVLNSSTSTNIKEIRFHGDFKFSLEALEEFLRKWKGWELSIFTSNYVYYRGDDYAKLIKRYKNIGVIKDFKCGYDEYELFDETEYYSRFSF
jgi:hypothetical protein